MYRNSKSNKKLHKFIFSFLKVKSWHILVSLTLNHQNAHFNKIHTGDNMKI